MTIDRSCDVLVVGGSAGGVAAALAAARAGVSVCLIEETRWLGGQLTVQGVCTPDENRYIEDFGCTQSYADFRSQVREYYCANYRLSPVGLAQQYLNPGSCWVSGLSYLPEFGAQILADIAERHTREGNLHIEREAAVLDVIMNPDDAHTIVAVLVRTVGGDMLRIRPRYVLDATDSGDVLARCGEFGVDWTVGAESAAETGEPDAPPNRRDDWVQPFTFPFAVDWAPNSTETNVIRPPEDYAELKALQGYHLRHGAITGMFEGRAPWWTYRRIHAKENFDDPRVPSDLIMVNTAGNDFYGGGVLGLLAGDEQQQLRTIQRARRAALGFLYWMQTECSREDGTGIGYPEIRLRPDVFGTDDGCSIRPYVRESRRILSRRPVLEQEIVVRDFSGRECRGDRARAAYMADSVGIGHYALDIHPNGHGEPNHFIATRPFQIPMGALIPVRLRNLLPASKNLGTTHLTNGAYRLHPIEWAVGEAAGMLAARCIASETSPESVWREADRRRAFQNALIETGVPLHWYVDIPRSHAAFTAVQRAAGNGLPLGSDGDLLFRPDEGIDGATWRTWHKHFGSGPEVFHGTRGEAIRTVMRC